MKRMTDAIGRVVSDAVKYKVNGHDSVIRSMLYDRRDGRCYSCTGPNQHGVIAADVVVRSFCTALKPPTSLAAAVKEPCPKPARALGA